MSDETDDDADDADDGEMEGTKKKVSGKKLILFVVLPLLVLIGAGVGVYMSGMLDPLLGLEETAEEEASKDTAKKVAQPGHFVELDEITVTLNASGSRTRFLKLQVTLELEKPEDEERVRAVMPRIVDNFQTFLRELRVEELEGSQGMYRVREELLSRVNAAADPVEVKEILFTDMLIQ